MVATLVKISGPPCSGKTYALLKEAFRLLREGRPGLQLETVWLLVQEPRQRDQLKRYARPLCEAEGLGPLDGLRVATWQQVALQVLGA